ncbi:MAG: glycerol-3-phosphate 1-O-acyltransferase PlsY [Clostridiales bacterium]|nr:glycerol-3-phosphate 1-O-acyltransferase PlsY [Clostridiales bacterium]
MIIKLSIYFVIGLTLLVSYLLGCFNGSVVTSHFIIRDDVRKHGSGNAGLTNFYRTYGAKYALIVIACDMGKTLLSCLIGGYLMLCTNGNWTFGVLLGGIGCELGHIFPAYYGLKGGKGILSGGVLVCMLDWRIALIAWGLFILLWLLTRYVSLGSIVGSASMPFTAFFVFDHDPLLTALCAFVSVLVIWCHRENIRRLLNGTENKFKWHINPLNTDENK